RPVDAVEAQDVLCHEMTDVRPKHRHEVLPWPAVGQGAEVINERVGPDVGDLALVPRQWDAPGLSCATDREVPQTALDEPSRLVRAEWRQHEVGLIAVERK